MLDPEYLVHLQRPQAPVWAGQRVFRPSAPTRCTRAPHLVPHTFCWPDAATARQAGRRGHRHSRTGRQAGRRRYRHSQTGRQERAPPQPDRQAGRQAGEGTATAGQAGRRGHRHSQTGRQERALPQPDRQAGRQEKAQPQPDRQERAPPSIEFMGTAPLRRHPSSPAHRQTDMGAIFAHEAPPAPPSQLDAAIARQIWSHALARMDPARLKRALLFRREEALQEGVGSAALITCTHTCTRAHARRSLGVSARRCTVLSLFFGAAQHMRTRGGHSGSARGAAHGALPLFWRSTTYAHAACLRDAHGRTWPISTSADSFWLRPKRLRSL